MRHYDFNLRLQAQPLLVGLPPTDPPARRLPALPIRTVAKAAGPPGDGGRPPGDASAGGSGEASGGPSGASAKRTALALLPKSARNCWASRRAGLRAPGCHRERARGGRSSTRVEEEP